METPLLVLLLSMITGCETSDKVEQCLGGWLEFSVKYSDHKAKETCPSGVAFPGAQGREGEARATKRDQWERFGRLHLFCNTHEKKLIVFVGNLTHKDFGKYKSRRTEIELEKEDGDDCKKPFQQSAYTASPITVSCRDHDGSFICKDDGFHCQRLSSLRYSTSDDVRFGFVTSKDFFKMSIQDVVPGDAGDYWCASADKKGVVTSGRRKIQLQVHDIAHSSVSKVVGETLTFNCSTQGHLKAMMLCQGSDPSVCKTLANAGLNRNDRFRFEKKGPSVGVVTVADLREQDAGTLWCGTMSSRLSRRSHVFSRRLDLTVAPRIESTSSGNRRAITTTATATAASPESTTDPQGVTQSQRQPDGPRLITLIGVVALLTLVLVCVLTYRLCWSGRKGSKDKTNEDAQSEDHCYAELDEREPPVSDPHYSTAHLPSHAEVRRGGQEAAGQDSAAYATVGPLYSTLTHPQQQAGP